MMKGVSGSVLFIIYAALALALVDGFVVYLMGPHAVLPFAHSDSGYCIIIQVFSYPLRTIH